MDEEVVVVVSFLGSCRQSIDRSPLPSAKCDTADRSSTIPLEAEEEEPSH